MAYPIDAALSEHYEEYIWTITDSDYDTLEWDSSNSIPKELKISSSSVKLTIQKPLSLFTPEAKYRLTDLVIN